MSGSMQVQPTNLSSELGAIEIGFRSELTITIDPARNIKGLDKAAEAGFEAIIDAIDNDPFLINWALLYSDGDPLTVGKGNSPLEYIERSAKSLIVREAMKNKNEALRSIIANSIYTEVRNI